MISVSILRSLLVYKPETGKFFWKPRDEINRYVSTWNSRYAGTEAFGPTEAKSGYRYGKVLNLNQKAHRIAWAMYHGEYAPKDMVIDHIDGDRSNNKISNLRLVSKKENSKNRAIPSNNTSGHMGVRWIDDRKKWHAIIVVNGSQKHIGYFEKLEDAIKARKSAEIEYGFHENHGRKRN